MRDNLRGGEVAKTVAYKPNEIFERNSTAAEAVFTKESF